MEAIKGMANLILHEKPAGVILSLKGSKGKYASVLAKETNCTYTHILKVLNQMQEFGVVRFKKEGRTKIVELTDKGMDIAHELEGLVRQLDKASEDRREPAETSEPQQ
ncbi:MAG: winged helix DNA-binding protein [Candidatus Altiarchaeota archaeon]|nr:winged helix DNA-binding protein [Candidatus Altiarchaeota archaeon]